MDRNQNSKQWETAPEPPPSVSQWSHGAHWTKRFSGTKKIPFYDHPLTESSKGFVHVGICFKPSE